MSKTNNKSYKYNWKLIKQEYKTGRYNIKQIAKKHGNFNNNKEFQAVYAYFRKKLKGVKVDKELEEAVTKSIQQKLMDELGTSEAKLRKEYAKLHKKLRKRLIEEMTKDRPKSKLIRDIKNAIQTLEICRKEEWEVFEIQEVAKKIENQIGFDDVDGVQVIIE